MPRATCRYPFEWKIFHWAKTFSSNLTGECHYAFVVALTEGGVTRKIIFGDRPEEIDRSEVEALQQGAPSWFFHHPFEGPEYTYVEWQNIDRGTMERLIGKSFEPHDFVCEGQPIEFPTTWGVMF